MIIIKNTKNMILKDTKFDFDDLLIVPKSSSSISSRKEVNVFDENGMLPLFTAPMDTVVGFSNLEIFKNNKIYPIIPRTATGGEWIAPNQNFWSAIGLKEFENFINSNKEIKEPIYILTDIANGHMKKLVNLVERSKSIYGNRLHLMVGNIANPETYKLLSEAGADYVRVGVGNGGGCWIEGTKVLTKNGYKNIEEISTDDEVLTHTGEWKPVILTHELDYCDKLVDINGEISTKDHQYYVINKKDANLINDENYQNYAFWIEAIDLTEDYLLLEIEKK
jgi:hypothetical protein